MTLRWHLPFHIIVILFIILFIIAKTELRWQWVPIIIPELERQRQENCRKFKARRI